MAYTELVIKIPTELYNQLHNKLDFNGDLKQKDIKTLTLAIDDGTLLPKGHGDLIDRKEFVNSINDWADDVDNYEAYEEVEIAKTLLRSHAHTIVEADKGSEK